MNDAIRVRAARLEEMSSWLKEEWDTVKARLGNDDFTLTFSKEGYSVVIGSHVTGPAPTVEALLEMLPGAARTFADTIGKLGFTSEDEFHSMVSSSSRPLLVWRHPVYRYEDDRIWLDQESRTQT